MSEMWVKGDLPARLLKGQKSTSKTNVMVPHPTCTGCDEGAVSCCRAVPSAEQTLCQAHRFAHRVQILDPACRAWDSYPGPARWDCPGTDKLRLNIFPGLSPNLQWLSGAFLCIQVPTGAQRPQYTETRGCRGRYRQETGHKVPGRQGESRWTGVAQIVHLLATPDFTLVNSPNSSPPSLCSIPCLHVHTDTPPQRLCHARHQPHLTSF